MKLAVAAFAIATLAGASAGLADQAGSVSKDISSSFQPFDKYIEPGWTEEFRLQKDINGDGDQDVVVIVRRDYKEIQTPTEENTFDPKRRTLLIAYGGGGPTQYRLVYKSNIFIPELHSDAVDEYLEIAEPLQATSAGFQINFNLFYVSGSWEIQLRSFEFQYTKGNISLIAYEGQTIHRSSGETSGIKVDYLKGLSIKSIGNIKDDDDKTVKTKFILRRLIKIQDIGSAFEFKPAAH